MSISVPSRPNMVPPSPAQAPPGHSPHPPAPTVSPYTPSARELHPGTRNRLFLALRSCIEEEVDWSLPRLVLASFDRPDNFHLETWVDSVGALREWPQRWLEELEREAAYDELIRERGKPSKRARGALGAIPEWTRDPAVENRATNSLLVLRNASFVGNNAKIICRTSFLEFLVRFFNLPVNSLLEVSARTPEPIQHILTVLQSIYPHLRITTDIVHLITSVLPRMAMYTRDSGLITLLLPLLISTFQIPTLPPPPDGFLRHMLFLVTLSPPPPTLDLILDLLAAMAPQAQYARSILSLPDFPAHLRSLVRLLEHSARIQTAAWEPIPALVAREVPNPASLSSLSEKASRRRMIEREADQANMELFGGRGVFREVNDKSPVLSQAVRSRLYTMTEPSRSITWMHETFVYSSNSQLLQVTFWHAYRDFFTNPATVEQLLSASEVIKNVTVAFPGAQAKVWTDERGETKFVIAGMGFRKGSEDDERFLCAWRRCAQPYCGSTNPTQLLEHVQQNHLTNNPTTCSWGSCQHAPFTLSHLLTHLPLAKSPGVPETIPALQSTPDYFLSSRKITSRPPPPLPRSMPLRFSAQVTPHDKSRNPTGVAFLAALVIRGLARNLRSEVALARPEDMGLSAEQRQEKKKHLAEDRFGLPIPASVIREEEEEEDEARGHAEAAITDADRERAVAAFQSVEERVLGVVNDNITGLGQYLGDAFGW